MTVNLASLVSDNLDIWTTAVERKSGAGRGGAKRLHPYGIDRLRALILDLAMRGRLVQQEPSDGNAATLLPRIDDERRKRVRAGELKSPKVSQDLRALPYKAPASWVWIPLGATGNIFTGNSINSSVRAKLESTPNGLPFVATKDIGYGFDPIAYDNGLFVPHNDPTFSIARARSVFICAEGGSAGKKIAISDREICFGNKLIANETWSVIDPRFVLYFYLSDFFFSEFSKEMTGIIGGISRAKFLALPFPLPPFAEQKRIVAKVDQLMALCDALEGESEAALASHQMLVQALLATLTASTEPADLATNWSRLEANFDTLFTTEASVDALKSAIVEVAIEGFLTETRGTTFEKRPLRDLLTFGPKNGFSPRAVERDTGIKSLSLSATTRGTFDGGHFKFVDIELPNSDSEMWLKNGDILIQRANSIEYVGVSALYDGLDNQFIYPDLMMKIRIIKSFDPRFVALCLNSGAVRAYFRSNASGTSGSMPKINQATVLNALLPAPHIIQQQRIVAKVNELLALCETLKARITETNATQRHLADAIAERAAH